jgi:hypothetical protein
MMTRCALLGDGGAAAGWRRAIAQTAFTPRDESPENSPRPGRDETFYACTACHNFKLVAAQGLSRAGWEDSINLMIRRHNMPPLDDKDREVVLNYLEAAYPPRAPAADRGWQNPFSSIAHDPKSCRSMVVSDSHAPDSAISARAGADRARPRSSRCASASRPRTHSAAPQKVRFSSARANSAPSFGSLPAATSVRRSSAHAMHAAVDQFLAGVAEPARDFEARLSKLRENLRHARAPDGALSVNGSTATSPNFVSIVFGRAGLWTAAADRCSP